MASVGVCGGEAEVELGVGWGIMLGSEDQPTWSGLEIDEPTLAGLEIHEPTLAGLAFNEPTCLLLAAKLVLGTKKRPRPDQVPTFYF